MCLGGSGARLDCWLQKPLLAMLVSAKSGPHIFDRGPYLARGDRIWQPKLILGTIFSNQNWSRGPFLATKSGPPGQVLVRTSVLCAKSGIINTAVK